MRVTTATEQGVLLTARQAAAEEVRDIHRSMSSGGLLLLQPSGTKPAPLSPLSPLLPFRTRANATRKPGGVD